MLDNDTKGMIKYHLEQLCMQVGSCEHKVDAGRITTDMLRGYCGELSYHVRQLEELCDNVDESVTKCEVCDEPVHVGEGAYLCEYHAECELGE